MSEIDLEIPGYVRVSPQPVAFVEVGESVEGEYIGNRHIVHRGQPRTHYHLRQRNGEVLFVWNTTVLDGEMVGVDVGDEIIIAYTGEIEVSGQPSAAKMLRVFRKVAADAETGEIPAEPFE